VLKPVGFWSYTRQDDKYSGGQLSRLRLVVGGALNLRAGEEVRLFQDTEAIPFGADWAAHIEQSISEVTFFIPVISPSFLRSKHCCDEFRAFRRRMAALDRDDLIFPIHYVDVQRFDSTESVFGDDFAALQRSNWIDFRSLFFDEPESSKARQWADALATSVLGAMRRESSLVKWRRSTPPSVETSWSVEKETPAARPLQLVAADPGVSGFRDFSKPSSQTDNPMALRANPTQGIGLAETLKSYGLAIEKRFGTVFLKMICTVVIACAFLYIFSFGISIPNLIGFFPFTIFIPVIIACIILSYICVRISLTSLCLIFLMSCTVTILATFLVRFFLIHSVSGNLQDAIITASGSLQYAFISAIVYCSISVFPATIASNLLVRKLQQDFLR
jgi:hypothetical protein